MLSTIVVPLPAAADANGRPGALLRTLAALVPATVEGVVRDVTLLQVGEAASLADIADEAGCQFVEERDFPAALARGVAGARSPWIFVVKAGTVPSRLFGEEAARALEGGLEAGRALLLREQPASLLTRWFPALAPVAGVILPRDRLAGAPCASFADVVRRARPARTLPTAAVSRV
ncbi:hypothetical protein D3273_03380 [Lichenibacterium minor]|uniref:Glycosyl transferase n=1 Tax=Lichenibacterium minor TaxID=2316528 RepID=A0A4Q2UAE2_9HYPH|nr:hypothetical protein [Lichenibacterium minor]RYC33522.1 hypothetical protein D3273_03380 [Lichenibacterium minor]